MLTFALPIRSLFVLVHYHTLAIIDYANSSPSPQDLEPRVPGDVERVPQVAELEPDRESAKLPVDLANLLQSGISSEGYKGKGMVMCD